MAADRQFACVANETNCCSAQTTAGFVANLFSGKFFEVECCSSAATDASQAPKSAEREETGAFPMPAVSHAAGIGVGFGWSVGGPGALAEPVIPQRASAEPTIPRTGKLSPRASVEAGDDVQQREGIESVDETVETPAKEVEQPHQEASDATSNFDEASATARVQKDSEHADRAKQSVGKPSKPIRKPRESSSEMPRKAAGEAAAKTPRKPKTQQPIHKSLTTPEALVDACAECGFEMFAADLSFNNIPVLAFSEDLSEQRIWHCGKVVDGKLYLKTTSPDLSLPHPVMMSPAMCGVSLNPTDWRYLHYNGVGLMFSRPVDATFMQPSIDTVLVCRGLSVLFEDGCIPITNAVDVGSGSGFIGKYIAARAPGEGPLTVTLVDIDPLAKEYCESKGFNAPLRGDQDRDISLKLVTDDACELLGSSGEKDQFDLIVSNPPYIPMPEEVSGKKAVTTPNGYWEGVGLVVHLIDLLLASQATGTNRCLVIMVTSLTLKAPKVRTALDSAAKRGIKIRSLVEQEVAWKAFYAGPTSGGIDHLLASTQERTKKVKAGGCDFFIGATKPGESRDGTSGRDLLKAYHWHVAYVLALQH